MEISIPIYHKNEQVKKLSISDSAYVNVPKSMHQDQTMWIEQHNSLHYSGLLIFVIMDGCNDQLKMILPNLENTLS